MKPLNYISALFFAIFLTSCDELPKENVGINSSSSPTGVTPNNQDPITNNKSSLKNITEFTTDRKGDYLLFHFTSPLVEDSDGYILELNASGKEVNKYNISDPHFAPSDVFYFEDNYYFVSGAYSNDTKVIQYNPRNISMKLLETNQDNYIEKYYKNGNFEYVTTVLDKNSNNELCNVNTGKCVKFSENYRTHEVSMLEDNIISVGVDTKAENAHNKLVSLKKMNNELETIEETYLDEMPNYFTYTDNKNLYLFMYNGDIVKIDSDLNTETYPIDLSSFSKNIEGVTYHKNVVLDENSILMNIELVESDNSISMLARISFGGETPKIDIVSEGKEMVLNVDEDHSEVYTRTYKNNKTVINIRDINSLKVKNTISLNNEDPIYFVDNIKKR
jgi:hypothetical protein